MSLKRRVVVTGLGAVTPLGGNLDGTWDGLINGKSGIGATDICDVSDMPCRVSGQVPGKDESCGFDAEAYLSVKEQRKIDRFILYGYAAACQAIDHAGLEAACKNGGADKERIGVQIGSGIGGLPCIEHNSVLLHEKGPRKISPFFIPASLINLTSGQVSMRYGYTGPNHSAVTACATGTHAIGDAAAIISRGDADVMVAGGAEAAICRIGIAGFCASRALSSAYNDTPEAASRPWDKGRDGFVMGEGAGVVVLEDYDHAVKRGATIYGECVGYGMSGDAHHITAPPEDGRGAFKAMSAALASSGLTAADIDYVNAHGTSTPLGDAIELKALGRAFEGNVSHTSVSSTKSAIGHLLGAAGGVEAIFALKAMETGILPPTLNLNDPSEGTEEFDLVPLEAKQKTVNAVMSNSFGFGGTNATLIFKRVS